MSTKELITNDFPLGSMFSRISRGSSCRKIAQTLSSIVQDLSRKIELLPQGNEPLTFSSLYVQVPNRDGMVGSIGGKKLELRDLNLHPRCGQSRGSPADQSLVSPAFSTMSTRLHTGLPVVSSVQFWMANCGIRDGASMAVAYSIV